MKPCLLAAGLLLLVSCARSSKDAAVSKGLEDFRGVWTVVSMVQDGKPLAAERLEKIKLTIQGENFTFETANDSHDGLYKIDPTKDPKELSIEVTRGDEQGKTYLVIYKFEDGKMIQCMQTDNKQRPSKFDGSEGTGCLLEVWQKQSP